METSLRYGVDSKSLVIHAKEKFPLNSVTHLQSNAELDTRIGAPTYLCAMIRRYFPGELSLSFSSVLSSPSLPSLNKKRQEVSQSLLNKGKPVRLAVGVQYYRRQKLWYNVRGKKAFPVTADESVNFHIKGKYDVDEKILEVPYFQISENNWTLNVNSNGKWNVRYAL
ncbi:hypothetical protein RND71_027288 [Anisodus tanguticus]|uniref:Uncharacterized protein n=1 Tax=Anisodus tanguticus TaxID=243964 RepID=A0AAE1RGD3_9SOLA|nr:hypothetical protein RND71_027288 [Anisodus tanguticus]